MRGITYHCRIDRKIFRRFAVFDTFILHKRWRLPAIFALIMTAFAIVCFLSGKQQSWLPGTILLVIGLGMPAVYAGTFLSQVNKKAAALKLDKPRAMYTVVLSSGDVNIHNDFKQEQNVVLPWEKVWGAVRVRDAVYLYAVPSRAFILPDGQADAPAGEVWAFLGECLPKDKLTVKKY
ncbi:MAG: hypothetical protein Q4G19_08685 [Clostridia bacterium]|nr:hypothetical protein [Clostridia bacterium]